MEMKWRKVFWILFCSVFWFIYLSIFFFSLRPFYPPLSGGKRDSFEIMGLLRVPVNFCLDRSLEIREYALFFER